jgi:hypothetical protein
MTNFGVRRFIAAFRFELWRLVAALYAGRNRRSLFEGARRGRRSVTKKRR